MEYRYTYEEVLDRINNARRFGKLPGVEVTRVMLKKLGNPQIGIPFVHVAGTNGKGSVCAFLSSILTRAGKKTGTFTSPHLIDFRERIVADGAMIPKEEVHRIGNLLLETEFGVEPTMFDYCLAMALIYFKEQDCDIMVIETGLGGRMDSTNAIGNPEVSVITRIGFDHISVLGNTIEEIAAEKAGILKPGSPLVLQRQEPEALKVITGQYFRINENMPRAEEKLFLVSDKEIASIRQMNLKMNGVHQWENGAAAMLAAAYLLEEARVETAPTEEPKPGSIQGEAAPAEAPENDSIQGEAVQTGELENGSMRGTFGPVDEEIKREIRQGLEQAVWPGRMEIIKERPFLMVDGAHNGDGVQALAKSLKTMYPGEKFHFIMGVMADKDYERMIEALLPQAEEFVTFTPESSRALQGKQLAECIRARGVSAEEKNELGDILDTLREDVKNIAFGSLYFIGELKNYVAHL